MIHQWKAIAAGMSLILCPTAFSESDGVMSTTAFRNAVISSMQDQSASELCVARLTDESFRVGPSMDDCEYHAFVDGASPHTPHGSCVEGPTTPRLRP